jgi:RNA polymerase III subunit Rpc25
VSTGPLNAAAAARDSNGGAAGAGVRRGGGGAAGAALQEAPPMGRQRSTSIDITTPSEAPPCMRITASINEDGLGLVTWW